MVNYEYCRRDINDKWLLLIVQFVEFKNTVKYFNLVMAELRTGQVSAEAQQMITAVTYPCHCFISSTYSRWTLHFTEIKCVDTISPLHIYYTASVECFTYLTFFTAVNCDATRRTLHICCFLTNYTLSISRSHKPYLDRNTKFFVRGWLHKGHRGNFKNAC